MSGGCDCATGTDAISISEPVGGSTSTPATGWECQCNSGGVTTTFAICCSY
jgi:hypothetical protein